MFPATALQVAPVPEGALMVHVGAVVYPEPLFVIVILPTTRVVPSEVVKVAPEPDAAEIVIVGGVV